jgi:RNA polymerase sigma-70 factor (ECF subfamily)
LNQWSFTSILEWGAGKTQAMDELSALRGLKDLDAPVIGAIYDQYFPQIYRYVLYRVADRQTAEDLASDVFVRLLEAVRTQRGPESNLKGWLIATASHAVSDHHRRNYRRPIEHLSDSMPDARDGLHLDIDHREQSEAVRRAYSELTEDQQHVLALRFGQGYSLEETAALMQKQINAVKSLQFRALGALQRRLGEVDNAAPS